jgi:PKD repeat protein
LLILAILIIAVSAEVTTLAQINQPDTLGVTPLSTHIKTAEDIRPNESIADTTLVSRFYYEGKLIDERVIGPGLPPAGWQKNANIPDMTADSVMALPGAEVPTLDWTYGCSATAATMYFGYYDRNGYPNMYTGPAGGGVFPLTNAVWGSGECPLTASHLGIDGRTTRGHVDDYWYSIYSSSDPYFGKWAEHTPKDSIGDYMGTNQYRNWQNSDGGTTFFFWPDGTPLYDYSGSESSGSRDGTHGMKLFAESRGYRVTSNYNQYIYGYNGNNQGFTFTHYKAEIDAGNPVFIQLNGHTVLGVGYSGTNTIIIHDTWDYSDHTMTWGGFYSGMQHYSVSVVHLAPPPPPASNFNATPRIGALPLTVIFTDKSTNGPTSWKWTFGDGSSSTEKNPTHAYTKAGSFNVSLTAMNRGGSTILTKTAYIQTGPVPVTNFSSRPHAGKTPLTVTFKDTSTKSPTSWKWTFGDGSYSTVKNPTHLYRKDGTFTVSLKATNKYGSTTVTKTAFIKTGSAPVAHFNATPRAGSLPLKVTFIDNSTHEPVSWNWTFGDGSYSTAKNPAHTYTKDGPFTISLNVTNRYGNNTLTKAAYIRTGPAPG